jgi:hypothetical protein
MPSNGLSIANHSETRHSEINSRVFMINVIPICPRWEFRLIDVSTKEADDHCHCQNR